MGSIKKKLTKTLRKITPKEIAPVLPFLAMAIPGMQAFASPLLRYGLPQLLTAAGSARTSGKINPLNQALAAFSSYAAGPGQAGKLTGKEQAFLESPEGVDFVTKGNVGTGADIVRSPDFAEALKASKVKSATPFQDLFTGATRMVGDPLRDLGAGNFNFKNLATVGGLGGTAIASDMAAKALAESKAENERLAGVYGDYDQAVKDYIDSFVNMESDPRRLYGLPNLFQTMASGGRVGLQEGGPISGITNMINQNIDEMQNNLSEQIQGGFTTQETIVPTETQDNLGSVNPIQRPSPPYSVVRPTLPGFYGNPPPKLPLRPHMPFPSNPFAAVQRPVRPNISSFTGMLERPGMPSGISSLMGFAEGGDVTKVAPGMPQGMQVDGRDGGFIPMGVKEKADDVPAMLSKNEFVMTADAVKAAGGGSVNKGAQRMYDLMNNLEAMV